MHIDQDQFEAVMAELETLEANFALPGDTPGYEAVWTPDGTIRLWSVPRTTGVWLREFVATHQPKTILELGTSSGYSALWMAHAAHVYGGHIYTIEVAVPKIELATRSIEKLGLGKVITIIPGSVATVLEAWQQPIDLLFMDADKAAYRSYLAQVEHLLPVGAHIVADNVRDYGHLMEDFLLYLTTSPHYETQIVAMDHGLLVAKRVSK